MRMNKVDSIMIQPEDFEKWTIQRGNGRLEEEKYGKVSVRKVA